MLTITINAFSVFDEKTDTFISVDEPIKLRMENSLWAIAEWEKKYKKSWLPDPKASKMAKKDQTTKTQEEMLYFIKCMILNYEQDEINDAWLYGLSESNFQDITDYLQDSQTALTSIPETKPDKKRKPDQVKMTSERIYAWMFELQMPLETEFWNINRLMNVIQVINYDNTPDDRKKSQKPFEVAQDYARINEERLKRLGKTKG
jgi:hypothetical protein